VCIDPYRTQTAKTADLYYLQPRLGTDGALGMMHALIEEGLVDHEYIHLATLGYGGDRNLLLGVPRRSAPQRRQEPGPSLEVSPGSALPVR
jgi:anaerobic selenocysteine-containing dehydrogenase